MADKPGSVEDNHSSRTNVTVCLKQPTQERYGPYLFTEANCSSIYPATTVTSYAVRSYRTLSPLPNHSKMIRRYTFCCTSRRLTPPSSYLAPCPLEPGLSSLCICKARLSGHLKPRSYLTPLNYAGVLMLVRKLYFYSL